MDIIFAIFIYLIGNKLEIIEADISHLTHGLIHQIHNLYGPPMPPVVEPFIPEIIINRKVKEHQGYDYSPPLVPPPQHNYLPPIGDTAALPPIQQFPENQPPIQMDQLRPPLNQAYLPPNSQNQEHNDQFSDIIVSYDPVQSDSFGYDYNVPTSSVKPISFPTPAPEADTPSIIDNEVEQSPLDQGYNYENPNNKPNLQHPISSYLPPDTFTRNAKDFDQFSVHSKNPIHLQLKEMRCLNNQGGYFRTSLKLDTLIGTAYPIVDSDSTDSRCELKILQSHIVIDIAAEDFQHCGVRNCGKNLCMRLRFPVIAGMKTGSDSILTLKCKIQERIVAKTHSLKVGIANDIQARSLGTYAEGGTQQPFRTHIELLRKLPNGFTRHVESKGAVQLGEELLLRAHVNAADGWNHTKLTDVNLQRISSSGEILNSANLITSSGCINPTMKAICPIPPSFDPPLGHKFLFKAVMFQGMRSGEELVMSIKIAGCLMYADCFVNTHSCGRSKRNTMKDKTTKNDTMSEFSEISTISFRVELPEDNLRDLHSIEDNSETILVIGGGILLLICIVISILILVYVHIKSI